MRIDHVAISKRAPVNLVPGTYRVYVPPPELEDLTDHRMIGCTLEIEAAA